MSLAPGEHLVYRHDTHRLAATLFGKHSYVQVAAVADGGRRARWDFMIFVKNHGDLEVAVDQFSWQAFIDAPHVFAALAGGVLDDLDGVVRILRECGVVEDERK